MVWARDTGFTELEEKGAQALMGNGKRKWDSAYDNRVQERAVDAMMRAAALRRGGEPPARDGHTSAPGSPASAAAPGRGAQDSPPLRHGRVARASDDDEAALESPSDSGATVRRSLARVISLSAGASMRGERRAASSERGGAMQERLATAASEAQQQPGVRVHGPAVQRHLLLPEGAAHPLTTTVLRALWSTIYGRCASPQPQPPAPRAKYLNTAEPSLTRRRAQRRPAATYNLPYLRRAVTEPGVAVKPRRQAVGRALSAAHALNELTHVDTTSQDDGSSDTAQSDPAWSVQDSEEEAVDGSVEPDPNMTRRLEVATRAESEGSEEAEQMEYERELAVVAEALWRDRRARRAARGANDF